MPVRKGRPRIKDDQKAKFRNVAVPLETYEMLREISDQQDRTMARQVAVLIKDAYLRKQEA
jgi:uncharacterized protein YaeQ